LAGREKGLVLGAGQAACCVDLRDPTAHQSVVAITVFIKFSFFSVEVLSVEVLKGRGFVPIRGREVGSYLGHGARSIH
jgi:hypothetical protein